MKKLLKVVLWWGATALVLWAIWYFAGETTINATLDGKPFGAVVEVDGVVVGSTPYAEYLGGGRHSIRVTPPKGLRAGPKEWRLEVWSVVRGQDHNVVFKRK